MNRKDIIDLYFDDEPDILFADGYDKAIVGKVKLINHKLRR